MKSIPAVVTPLDEHMGLDIARSLGQRGIPVYGIDLDRNAPGKHSKYCSLVPTSGPSAGDEAEYLRLLIDFGQSLADKAALFPLSDAHVLLCSRERDVLQQYYEYVMPPHYVVDRLLTKNGLREVAEDCAIPAPQTFFVNDAAELESIVGSIAYPAIIKPIESTYWHTGEIATLLRTNVFDGRTKVIKCQNAAELLETYHRISTLDDRIVVQEVIPGEDERLVYFSFYLDRYSRALGIFGGRKYRVLPVGFGSASYVRSFYDPELEEVSCKLLSATGYQGLGGIEFKKDPRDGQYKLIEFNARFGMWDGLSVRCGVDLPYIAYCDTLNLPVESRLTYRHDVIWVDWQRDVRAAFMYWRQKKLTPGQWLRSLQGEKMSAVYSKDDWRPGVFYTYDLARQMWQRVVKF